MSSAENSKRYFTMQSEIMMVAEQSQKARQDIFGNILLDHLVESALKSEPVSSK